MNITDTFYQGRCKVSFSAAFEQINFEFIIIYKILDYSFAFESYLYVVIKSLKAYTLYQKYYLFSYLL